MKKTILIVDDKVKVCVSLAQNFEHLDYHTVIVTGVKEALSAFSAGGIDVVLLDIMLGKESGIDLLKNLQAINKAIPVIMITAFASVETAVQSLKLGAFDYVKKPIDFDELLIIVEKALEFSRLQTENTNLKSRLRELSVTIISSDSHMTELRNKMDRLAQTDLPVLVLGESGTGKEVLADYIHAASSRSALPMVKINCVAFAETLLDNELFGHEKGAYTGADSIFKGLFEKADKSTLFLDEIGDMPLSIQAKILRTLQNSEIRRLGGSATIKIDVRFIAATNKDLLDLIRKNLFREDLYYRLNAAVLTVPPLRERKGDIPLLVDHFLAEHIGNCRKELSHDVAKRFLDYSWPGNVRELKNVLSYATAMSRGACIEMEDLPVNLFGKGDNYESVDIRQDMDKDLIIRILQNTKYNRSKTAEILNMSRKTLYNKMEKYGLNI